MKSLKKFSIRVESSIWRPPCKLSHGACNRLLVQRIFSIFFESFFFHFFNEKTFILIDATMTPLLDSWCSQSSDTFHWWVLNVWIQSFNFKRIKRWFAQSKFLVPKWFKIVNYISKFTMKSSFHNDPLEWNWPAIRTTFWATSNCRRFSSLSNMVESGTKTIELRACCVASWGVVWTLNWEKCLCVDSTPWSSQFQSLNFEFTYLQGDHQTVRQFAVKEKLSNELVGLPERQH